MSAPTSSEATSVKKAKEGKWYAPFLRTARALLELLAHILVVAGLLAGIRLLEEIVHRLWGQAEYLFFGKISLKYVFDAGDLAILIGFLTYGVYSVIKAYVRHS